MVIDVKIILNWSIKKQCEVKWTQLGQDWVQWLDFVNMVMNPLVP
jgi:hypothetical protein